MGKKKLYSAMIIGAAAGGLISLFNRDVRLYTKVKLAFLPLEAKYLLKNPSEAVYNTRIALDRFNKGFNNSAEQTMNALEQVESTLEKVVKKKGENQIVIK